MHQLLMLSCSPKLHLDYSCLYKTPHPSAYLAVILMQICTNNCCYVRNSIILTPTEQWVWSILKLFSGRSYGHQQNKMKIQPVTAQRINITLSNWMDLFSFHQRARNSSGSTRFFFFFFFFLWGAIEGENGFLRGQKSIKVFKNGWFSFFFSSDGGGGQIPHARLGAATERQHILYFLTDLHIFKLKLFPMK